MKRNAVLVLFLLALSAITGYLLSKASLVGRAGINLFYTQYKFLKVWWQAGLLIFLVWLVLFSLQGMAHRKLLARTSKLIQMGAIGIALLGLFFTYQDFRHTLSHRWLGERFHLGGYLFWIGWIIVSVFYLTAKSRTGSPLNSLNSKNTYSATGNNNP